MMPLPSSATTFSPAFVNQGVKCTHQDRYKSSVVAQTATPLSWNHVRYFPRHYFPIAELLPKREVICKTEQTESNYFLLSSRYRCESTGILCRSASPNLVPRIYELTEFRSRVEQNMLAAFCSFSMFAIRYVALQGTCNIKFHLL